MRRAWPFWKLTLLITILPTTGCLFRTRTVEQQYSKAPLQAATQKELVEAINRQAEKVRSLQATVDLVCRLLLEKKKTQEQHPMDPAVNRVPHCGRACC